MLEFIVLGHIPFTSIYLPFGVTMIFIGLIIVSAIGALFFLSFEPSEDIGQDVLEIAAQN